MAFKRVTTDDDLRVRFLCRFASWAAEEGEDEEE
jgi:hypothetical protein